MGIRLRAIFDDRLSERCTGIGQLPQHKIDELAQYVQTDGIDLGRVNTNDHSYGILHGWNSTKRRTSRSSIVCRNNPATSAIRICSFSIRSCTWPSMVAS